MKNKTLGLILVCFGACFLEFGYACLCYSVWIQKQADWDYFKLCNGWTGLIIAVVLFIIGGSLIEKGD